MTLPLIGAIAERTPDIDAMMHGALAAPAPSPSSGIPDPPPSEIPGLGPLMEKFIGWGKWVVRGAGVIGILWCAAMMILGRRNRSAMAVEGAVGVPWVVGGMSLAAVAVTLVGSVF
ncbi:hypothetical protein [Cryptosporangium aurantiacum]|uniref:Uncharacterized protein n=1 Tax=Cryptosporangium aurantiacum TaxID=134849 RepID=A0A1M7PQG1_9ACTN|nr:hypothetical protein [Cryptosporangium aurantiacum]SHN19446.1 hypothetical protein SAMN05443668_103574 [Cryptosporangium aurantiacum]